MVMVKPGMAYLDIVRQTKDKVKHHQCCYSVSTQMSWIKEHRTLTNLLLLHFTQLFHYFSEFGGMRDRHCQAYCLWKVMMQLPLKPVNNNIIITINHFYRVCMAP